jgi:beta-galactosidase
MKQIFLIIVWTVSAVFAKAGDSVLYCNQIFAPSEGYVSKIEKPLRKEFCLNGRWDFQAIELPAGYQQGKGTAPALPQPDEGKWDKVKIKIPSPWNINAFANRNLEGPDHRNFPSYPEAWENVKMAWMRKQVSIPTDWNNDKIILRFEAVAGQTEVRVNGHIVAENFDLFLPFEADITPYVKPGESVDILVGVRSQSLFEDNSTKGRRIVPAGSMWGYHVNGIWQDVYLIAVPKINIANVYVKPLVSQNHLELDILIENSTDKDAALVINGDIREWINKAGTDVHSAPVPDWELARAVTLNIPEQKLAIQPGINSVTVRIPVKEGDLDYWTPEFPNLYGITLFLKPGKDRTLAKTFLGDVKYERFGWREWTFDGTRQLLNGKVYQLKGDSWHFMGVPQLTRRYAWAWYTALKDANANAVRPHAQVYPRFYFDMADEMGICILAETANWASDGGPKMDSPLFWEHSKDHLKRMVLRDRNHPAVFGWSISNENKPVILHVFNKPEWMEQQKQAWIDWRDTVRTYDTTRPWISSDGEDDGDGILPTTVGHYGDRNSMKRWIEIGKPWGIGEHSMAYYGTPEQVSKYNGERAYESQCGRMEGLAYECYDLIAQQRQNGASYVSVFNIAWYSLQPLPFGKRDQATAPTLNDGIHFGEYREGVPGIQPERMGPYCSTFNPGYDPTLPLYKTWPMFEAIKAANAGDAPAWSRWSQMPAQSAKQPTKEENKTATAYGEIFFIGDNTSLKQIFENHGVTFVPQLKQVANALIILDGKYRPSEKEITLIREYANKGTDVWIWAPVPNNIAIYNTFLPAELILKERKASSFLPCGKSWLKNTVNSDFYFVEIQRNDVSQWGMAGDFVREGEVLLEACNTDWRRWNQRPEELKTASVLRSENEAKGPDAVFVKYPARRSVFYVSALDEFASTEKGYNTLDKILAGAGIPVEGRKLSDNLIDAQGYVKIANLFSSRQNNRNTYRLWVWSPRSLDDLLIEPNMPELDIAVEDEAANITLNGKRLNSLKTVPMKQGWNQVTISLPNASTASGIRFVCGNNAGFVSQLKTSFNNPDNKK